MYTFFPTFVSFISDFSAKIIKSPLILESILDVAAKILASSPTLPVRVLEDAKMRRSLAVLDLFLLVFANTVVFPPITPLIDVWLPKSTKLPSILVLSSISTLLPKMYVLPVILLAI